MRLTSASLVAVAVTLVAAVASAQSAGAPTGSGSAPAAGYAQVYPGAPPPAYAPPATYGAYAPPATYGGYARPASPLQTYAPAPAYGGSYRAAPPPVVWGSDTTEYAPEGSGRRSPALMATGFSMAGVGAIALSFGIFFHVLESSIVVETECFAAPCDQPAPSSGHSTASTAAMIAGGALMAVGLPLGIYGATKKPSDAGARAPVVALGPTSAHLGWAF